MKDSPGDKIQNSHFYYLNSAFLYTEFVKLQGPGLKATQDITGKTLCPQAGQFQLSYEYR